jgi:hypothetical protein
MTADKCEPSTCKARALQNVLFPQPHTSPAANFFDKLDAARPFIRRSTLSASIQKIAPPTPGRRRSRAKFNEKSGRGSCRNQNQNL